MNDASAARAWFQTITERLDALGPSLDAAYATFDDVVVRRLPDDGTARTRILAPVGELEAVRAEADARIAAALPGGRAALAGKDITAALRLSPWVVPAESAYVEAHGHLQRLRRAAWLLDSLAQDTADPYPALAATLRGFREGTGLSQGAFGATIDMPRTTVVGFETGARHPSLDVLYAWAAGCGYRAQLDFLPIADTDGDSDVERALHAATLRLGTGDLRLLLDLARTLPTLGEAERAQIARATSRSG